MHYALVYSTLFYEFVYVWFSRVWLALGFFSSSAIPSQDGCIAVSCTIVADFIYFGICVQL